MGRRRRRGQRERRYQEDDGAAKLAAQPAKRVVKAEQKRRAEYEDTRRRLERRRTIIGLLSLLPLVAPFVGVPDPLALVGVPANQGWFLVWGALFGSFLGLTIRLVLERRKFTRGAANERAA